MKIVSLLIYIFVFSTIGFGPKTITNLNIFVIIAIKRYFLFTEFLNSYVYVTIFFVVAINDLFIVIDTPVHKNWIFSLSCLKVLDSVTFLTTHLKSAVCGDANFVVTMRN